MRKDRELINERKKQLGLLLLKGRPRAWARLDFGREMIECCPRVKPKIFIRNFSFLQNEVLTTMLYVNSFGLVNHSHFRRDSINHRADYFKHMDYGFFAK